MTVERVALAHGGFVACAAEQIVERHRAAWPDLSGLLVLVPDLHCAADIARALAAAGGGGAVLLPRITTLAALSAGLDLPYGIAAGVTPQSVREVELYALLLRSDSLADTDLWSLAAELVVLFDRMTLARSRIARDRDEFTDALRAAYRSNRNQALQFEAALVHELWWAQAPQRLQAQSAEYTRAEGELAEAAPAAGRSARARRKAPAPAALDSIDPASAHALRLAALAQGIDTPVFAIALETPVAVDRSFLDACAGRVPVVQFDPVSASGGSEGGSDRGSDGGGRRSTRRDAVEQTLELAWPAAAGASLRDRATTAALTFDRSPLHGRISLLGADSLEQQASAIDVAVRRALLAGNRRVGVVVLDRLVARRARALLERAAVPVVDESGWLLSTTVAAACIGRLLDVATSRGYHRELIDLMRSPFVFGGMTIGARNDALSCIERALARHDVADGINAMIGLFGRDEPDEAAAVSLLERIAQAIEALDTGARKPLAAWLDALGEALDRLGARDSLAADAAGVDLLDLIDRRRAELRGHEWRASFAQWRAWFTRTLEAASFSPRDVQSPVVFTYLAATRLRAFDMLVLAGADAAHLPAVDAPGSFFNQAVRARLGLPTRELQRSEIERSLRLALCNVPRVLVTWQARVSGQIALVSPWIARLQALHRRAWPDQPLDAVQMTAADIMRASVRAPALARSAALPAAGAAPAPAAPLARAPRRMSVSGYETLVACPYRYFAGTLLGLQPSDEVTEALEKSDFGELVHEILARFHGDPGTVTALGREAAIERLQALSNEAFARALRRNFIDRAWLARWVGSIPAYVDWQLGREADGWRVAAVEADRHETIISPAQRTLLFKGRLDRIDQRVRAPGAPLAGGSTDAQPVVDRSVVDRSVVDYKAQGATELKKRAAQPGEHVQLAAYAMLAGTSVSETLFLSIARDEVTPCASDGDPQDAAAANRVRLGRLVDRLHEQAPMPANGVERVCEWCDVRGLCRRDHWTAAPSPSVPDAQVGLNDMPQGDRS